VDAGTETYARCKYPRTVIASSRSSGQPVSRCPYPVASGAGQAALRTIREYVHRFETTQEEVSQLRVLVNGTEEFAPYSGKQTEVELVDRYLDLLRAFNDTYREEFDTNAANRIAITKATQTLSDFYSTCQDYFPIQ
jgi:hypothetical protein